MTESESPGAEQRRGVALLPVGSCLTQHFGYLPVLWAAWDSCPTRQPVTAILPVAKSPVTAPFALRPPLCGSVAMGSQPEEGPQLRGDRLGFEPLSDSPHVEAGAGPAFPAPTLKAECSPHLPSGAPSGRSPTTVCQDGTRAEGAPFVALKTHNHLTVQFPTYPLYFVFIYLIFG